MFIRIVSAECCRVKVNVMKELNAIVMMLRSSASHSFKLKIKIKRGICYEKVCPSVHTSVHPSVRPSVSHTPRLNG